jgi:hypothetical protein
MTRNASYCAWRHYYTHHKSRKQYALDRNFLKQKDQKHCSYQQLQYCTAPHRLVARTLFQQKVTFSANSATTVYAHTITSVAISASSLL